MPGFAPPFIIALILLLGVVLRVCGAMGDLWLDEILSFQAVERLDSWTQIFTTLHSDNTHILNSLQLYVLSIFNAEIAARVPESSKRSHRSRIARDGRK